MVVSSTVDVSAMTEQLKVLLGEDMQPVTYRWLCHEFACSAAVARKVLLDAATKWADTCAVSYCVIGVTKETKQRVIRIVKCEDLTSAQDALQVGFSTHVYAIAPVRHAPDSATLHAHDLEQARKLMTRLCAGDTAPDVTAFASNSCSRVQSDVCQRVENTSAAARMANATSGLKVAGGSSAKSRGSSGVTVGGMLTGKRSNDTSQLQDKSNLKAPALPPDRGTETAEKRAPPKAASAPVKAKSVNAMAAAFGKAVPRPPKNAPEAPDAGDAPVVETTIQKSEAPSIKGVVGKRVSRLDDDDDMPENDDTDPSQSPLQTKQPFRPIRQRLVLDDDDDEDDFDMDASNTIAPPPVAASVTRQAAATTTAKKSATKNSSDPAAKGGDEAADDAAVTVPDKRPAPDIQASGSKRLKTEPQVTGVAAPEVLKPESSAPVHLENGAKLLESHPQYGVSPDEDAEIKIISGRPFWMYMNDKGEEIQIAAKPKPKPVVAKVAKEEAEVKKEGSTSKSATTKSGAKPGKKSAPVKSKGRDIRSMFGKR